MNPYVLETFQSYRFRAGTVNLLKSQDFHTWFQESQGSRHPGRLASDWRLSGARKRAPASEWPPNSAHANTEDDENIKDRLEALLFAETLQEPCPRMRTPEVGSNRGLTELDAPSPHGNSAGRPRHAVTVLGS